MTGDPYAINGPALISFSGGRTSAYMLYQILSAHDGRLPESVQVVFANTGRERNETLDFVAECQARWGVRIAWVEFVRHSQGRDVPYSDRFQLVSHNSASRDGAPFAAAIEQKGMLPNPVMRFCTQTLKIRAMRDYMLSLGFTSWTNAVGLRADEPGRVVRAVARNQSGKEPYDTVTPMYDAGATERDVLEFWREQPFDLQLRSFEGNCDLCFLKGGGKITRIMRERPDLAEWWMRQEEKIEKRGYPNETAKFRSDRPSYADLLKWTQDQGVLPFSFFDDHADCEVGCTDQEPEADLCNLRARARQ